MSTQHRKLSRREQRELKATRTSNLLAQSQPFFIGPDGVVHTQTEMSLIQEGGINPDIMKIVRGT